MTPEERYEDYEPQGDVEPTIQNFISAVENQSVDPMPLNEAVWKVEAALNYENRYQRFAYTESFYDTLSFDVPINGDLVDGQALATAYEQLSADPTGGIGHYVLGDVQGYYSPSSGQGTLQVFIKVAHDKNPWDDRDISVGERQAGFALDCSDPALQKPNKGFELVAKKALAKYRNQISYNPNKFYYNTSIVNTTLPSGQYAGGRNALIPNDRGGTYQGIYPDNCITQADMVAYRDFIFGQLYNLNHDVVDLKLVWDRCYYQSTSSSDAKWGYTNCPGSTTGYVKIAQSNATLGCC